MTDGPQFSKSKTDLFITTRSYVSIFSTYVQILSLFIQYLL